MATTKTTTTTAIKTTSIMTKKDLLDISSNKTKMIPRPYQKEAFQKRISQNTIVLLPTGLGKTLIAIMVIDHYLAQKPKKKILFIVPTVALVKQQANYCRKYCSQLNSNSEMAQIIKFYPRICEL